MGWLSDGVDSFLQLSDILCPNETELALLCRGDVDPDDYDSVHKGARELIERGAPNTSIFTTRPRENAVW